MSRSIQPHVAAKREELRKSILVVLRELVGGKTLLLFGSATGSQLMRQYFLDSGASRILDLPSPPRIPDHSISTHFQLQDDELLRPGDSLRAEVSRIDPKRQAVVYAGSCVTAEALDGRPVLGRRRPEWRESERKKYQSDWTRGQEDYTPQYIDFFRGPNPDDLLQYCMEHLPCVVSGDAKDCIAMGADYVYVLEKNTPFSTVADISRLLHGQCEGVRVAPLSEGMPATYYGVVSDDRHVLYGPVEALVGFHAIRRKVVAPGILIPVSVSDRVRRRAVAYIARLVKTLVTATGYRGAFGIDGCLNSNGLIVHEINTRLCAGFSLLSRLYGSHIPFGVIDLIIREASPDRCSRVLALLEESADTLCLTADVKLWEDSALEDALRQRIPRANDRADLDRWRVLVRSSVLAGNTPLYDGC